MNWWSYSDLGDKNTVFLLINTHIPPKIQSLILSSLVTDLLPFYNQVENLGGQVIRVFFFCLWFLSVITLSYQAFSLWTHPEAWGLTGAKHVKGGLCKPTVCVKRDWSDFYMQIKLNLLCGHSFWTGSNFVKVKRVWTANEQNTCQRCLKFTGVNLIWFLYVFTGCPNTKVFWMFNVFLMWKRISIN